MRVLPVPVGAAYTKDAPRRAVTKEKCMIGGGEFEGPDRGNDDQMLA